MTDENVDPSGNTAAFRAFANSPEPTLSEPSSSSKAPLLIGIAFAAILVLALALWLALG